MRPLRRSAGETFPIERALGGSRRLIGPRDGPWAVVTGANEFSGRALARSLAAAGLHLVLVDRHRAPLAALAARMQRAHGTPCRVLVLDLLRPFAVRRLANATADLDVGLLVATAGFSGCGPMPGGESSLSAQSCRAVTALAWYFGHRLSVRGGGGVVFVNAWPRCEGSPHAATDDGLQRLVDGLRAEWAPNGVDVIHGVPDRVATGDGRPRIA